LVPGSKPLILIVDDEPSIVELIRFHLEKQGYAVISAGDGPTALDLVNTRQPDLVLLDLMLPGLDGFEICRRLRADSPDLPIIILTAKQEEIDKVLGLEIGADDYITKPFGTRELVARIKAVLRRSSPSTADLAGNSGEELTTGSLRINVGKFKAYQDGVELELTRKEFALLHVLASNPGHVFDRESLVETVWGYDYFGDTRTVDVHIRRLRAKLKNPNLIETVHGVGYRFREDP